MLTVTIDHTTSNTEVSSEGTEAIPVVWNNLEGENKNVIFATTKYIGRG